MLRIVHLSDIHLNQTQLIDLDNFVIKGLLNDLNKFHEENPIDLILFTGDLIDKGGDSFGDIELAFLTFEERVIEPICKSLRLPKERIYFCPGNHDIDRDADNLINEKGLLSTLASTESVNKYMDSGDLTGKLRMLPFKEFKRDYYDKSSIQKEISNYQSSFKVKIDELDIGITCFNSSWRCYDSSTDRGKIILGERQITNARKIIEDSNLKIALIHHPLDWLSSFEQKAVSAFIQRDYHLLFCGHVHEGSSWTVSSMYANQFVSLAPTNWAYGIRNDERSHANGYSIIDYNELDNSITVNHRRYSYFKESFDPNADLGDANGQTVFKLPSSEEISNQNFQLDIANKIKALYFEETNEHLLSYHTDTLAPKTLSEIFVLPFIVDKPLEEKAECRMYSLDDLCEENSNLIFLGSKESGKTTLLDRIFVELTSNIKKYKKIPIYINWDEFTHAKLETLISRFISIPIREVQNVINSNRIIILIDNLTTKKNAKAKTLDLFIKNNLNVQVICTMNQLVEGGMPFDLLNHESLKDFKPIWIKEFKAKQIRQLMIIWFSSDKSFNISERLEKLLLYFSTLNIPRTPLSVTMFLWILEQQGKYKPINNATMLQNFVERLFEKHSTSEIYSETFDFTNKERLLISIARKMYDTNNQGYSLPYIELSNFLYETIKRKKFDSIVTYDQVLEEFISKGILGVYSRGQEHYVKFRFGCFFKYFLMKNMDIDLEFKNYVLSEENYLKFIDEIDYYTGLKRDQADILSLIIDRMSKEFAPIHSKIEALKYGFDTLFETKRSIASTLDKSFVKEITAHEKPTEEELDHMRDNMLDKIETDTEVENKHKEIQEFERLELLWVLAAKVLKNTEETEIKDLKSESYKSILLCSMAFCNIYK